MGVLTLVVLSTTNAELTFISDTFFIAYIKNQDSFFEKTSLETPVTHSFLSFENSDTKVKFLVSLQLVTILIQIIFS